MTRILTRALLGLVLSGLVACAQYEISHDEAIIILENPVEADPAPIPKTGTCDATSGGVDDGIGGTGCKAAETI